MGWPLRRLELLDPTDDMEDVRLCFGSGKAGPSRSSSASSVAFSSIVSSFFLLRRCGLPQPPGKLPEVGGLSVPVLGGPVIRCA